MKKQSNLFLFYYLNILTLNKIAACGLDQLDDDKYSIDFQVQGQGSAEQRETVAGMIDLAFKNGTPISHILSVVGTQNSKIENMLIYVDGFVNSGAYTKKLDKTIFVSYGAGIPEASETDGA